MGDHDHAYKLLFSHRAMVRDLLQGFVRARWSAELDYESLKRVNGSYVSEDWRDRADDIVWRVRWGGHLVYLYLLIEFQSTVEHYMAVWIQAYLALLYQDLIRTKQLPADGLLPPVYPIVLYRGEARWTGPQDLGALLQPGPPEFERYRPAVGYLLIDAQRYSDRELAPLHNYAAALFRLEKADNPGVIRDVLRSLAEWLRPAELSSLRRAFAAWVNRVILKRLPDGPAAPIEDLLTMSTFFEERFHKWAEDVKRESRTEGRAEGEALLLQRQLRKRFGELPDWAVQRLQQAQPEQLERWGERLLEVGSLAALFDGE